MYRCKTVLACPEPVASLAGVPPGTEALPNAPTVFHTSLLRTTELDGQ